MCLNYLLFLDTQPIYKFVEFQLVFLCSGTSHSVHMEKKIHGLCHIIFLIFLFLVDLIGTTSIYNCAITVHIIVTVFAKENLWDPLIQSYS